MASNKRVNIDVAQPKTASERTRAAVQCCDSLKMAYKGGRGPFGYKPRELEQTLIMLLLDEAQPTKPATSEESTNQPSGK
ncbi:MAG: hypothetical protein FD138_3428 [Planctomycetota bacterium]|nr:MAG: hypothetical protein FD138_3428 [Planctomycetota bacterium]